MKHLVVVAHPVETSFTMTLARTYAAELKALGHEPAIHDLYRAQFNPVLPDNELGDGHPPAADIARAQNDIRAADVITVIYPLWWMSMPAMMKGYVDRVFARGFAYEADGGIVRGLLPGKQCVLVTVSGAPLPVLIGSGRWNAVTTLQDTHIFRAVGFELLEHVHFDEVLPNLPAAIVEHHLARMRACAQQHFRSRR